MLKRIFLAALLLPVAFVVIADEDGPNPGDDNPGTTYIEREFTYSGTGDGNADCLAQVQAGFCMDAFENPLVPSFDGLKGKELREAEALAAGYGAFACAVATSSAASNYQWFFEGGGFLTLARHGNHGSMHRIRFDAALESGTMTFAVAETIAGADAFASVVASAEVSGTSIEDFCVAVAEDNLPEDHPAVQLCLRWDVYGFAESSAEAMAGAFANSAALAESSSFGAVTNQTEVWAANIEKFVSVATTAAESFSMSDANASANVFAHAYANAFASAFIDICAELNDGEDNTYAEICEEWEAVDAAYAEAYANAWANATANAWAQTSILAVLPVTYVNENGIVDTILWGPDATWVAEGDTQVTCEASAAAATSGDEP